MEQAKSEIFIEQIRPELTWRLRRDVLYPAMKMHEMGMDEDLDGIHFGAFADNKLAGVVSLFQKGTDFQFRKFAIEPSFQNQKIGSRMLQYITDFVIENSGRRIWCNARTTAFGFYLKAGYMATDKRFTKNGYDYLVMEKALNPAKYNKKPICL
jgi:phosphoribosylformimino-5-aminoimidazole carboxamide ribotide isomerase